MGVVFWKELADHFSSRRFMILLALIVLIGLWATYASGQAIRQDTDNSPPQYVFLLLLTSSSTVIFSLATFLGFFGPLVGITLCFDSISGEYARGTLSRVLSQPIYRDSLINGKFFAGLATVALERAKGCRHQQGGRLRFCLRGWDCRQHLGDGDRLESRQGPGRRDVWDDV